MPDLLGETALEPRSRVLLPTSTAAARSVTSSSAAPVLALAPGRRGKAATAATGATTDVLVVSDKQGRAYALAYARFTLALAKAESAVRTANSWRELVAILQQYKRIGILVLHFHGIPGELIIGGEARSAEKFAVDLGNQAPEVSKRLLLESCSVGEGVDKLVPLAQATRTPELHAWNHFTVNQSITLQVPKGSTAAQIEEKLKGFLPQYLLPGTPTPTQLAARPGTHTLFAVWFRADLNNAPLPPKSGGDPDTREKIFKPRRSATDRRVTHSAAKNVAEEYAGSPVLPLERVILVPD